MAAFRAAEPKGVCFEAQCALDEAFSALGARHDRAVEHLLLAPAPDLPALAAKIALLTDQQAWELPRGDACLEALEADAMRLSTAHSPSC
jgi:thiamine pyrophosphokinase